MATETEIERMVVRLVGDASQYVKTLEQAQEKTESFGRAVLSVLGAIGAKNWIEKGLHNFEEAELIGLKLTAALEANGRQVDQTREEYRKFAAEMERTTTAEDDAVLGMLQVAESLGITGKAAERAVKNSIALAAAKGGEAQAYIRLTAALEQGNSEMLGRMLPALRGIEDDSERAAKAQEMLAKMFGTARAEAESHSGKLKILHRDYGNLLEDFGELAAEVAGPVVKALTDLTALFKSMPTWLKAVVVALAALTAGILASAAAMTTWKMLGISTVLSGIAAGAKSAAAFLTTYSIAANGAAIASKALTVAISAAPWLLLASAVALVVAKMQQYKNSADQLKSKQDALVAKELERIQSEADQLGMADRKKLLEKARADAEAGMVKFGGAAPNNPDFLVRNMKTEVFQEIKKGVEDMIAALGKGDELPKKMSEGVKALTKSLQEQVDTFGMTAYEVERYRITQQATTPETKKAVEAALEQADALNMLKEEIERVKKAEEEAARVQEEEHNRALERAEQITRDLMTPFERYVEATGELQRLFDEGMISAQTFERGMAAQEEALNGVEEQAMETKGAIEALDAVFSGSNEARRRQLEFRDALRSQRAELGLRMGNATPTSKASSSDTAGSPVKTNELLQKAVDSLEQLVEKPDLGDVEGAGFA